LIKEFQAGKGKNKFLTCGYLKKVTKVDIKKEAYGVLKPVEKH